MRATTIGLADITGGKLKFTPATNASGSGYASFTFKVRDDGGTADGGDDLDPSADTITINVTADNDDPDAVDDTLAVARNAGPTAVDVLGNDTDAENDTLQVTGKTNGAKGSVTITGGGTGLTYDPAPGPAGTDTFTYTISDGNGGVDTATVHVTISNTAPDAVDDTATVNEDAAATAVPVLANDTDGNGDTLTITGKTDGAKGVVVITGGGTGLTYRPTANSNGSDTFTYTVSDGNGGTDTASVSVTIDPVKDPPVAVDDTKTVGATAGADRDRRPGQRHGPRCRRHADDHRQDRRRQGHGRHHRRRRRPDLRADRRSARTGHVHLHDRRRPRRHRHGDGPRDHRGRPAPVADDDTGSMAEDAAATAIDVLANDSDPDLRHADDHGQDQRREGRGGHHAAAARASPTSRTPTPTAPTPSRTPSPTATAGRRSGP